LGVGTAHAYSTYFDQDLSSDASFPIANPVKSTKARKNFVSNLTGVGTEDFEGIAVGTTGSPGLSLNFRGNGVGTLKATLTGAGTVLSDPVDAFTGSVGTDSGRYSVPGGMNYWSADLTAPASNSFTITVDKAIAAFGFYGTDISDFGGQAYVEVSNGGTLWTRLDVPSKIGTGSGADGTDGSALYFGFIAQNTGELFNTVRFRSTYTGSSGDVFGFDGFTIAEAAQLNTPLPSSQTPEPTTMTLVGALLLGLGISRRRA
jgi:hypothetical protein